MKYVGTLAEKVNWAVSAWPVFVTVADDVRPV